MENNAARIEKVTLVHNMNTGVSNELLEQDREVALDDLSREGYFQPSNDEFGPYKLALSIEENRLVMRIKNALGAELPILALSINPYKSLIKDYFMMVESYENARQDAPPCKLEAIDMGRRGIHNEGAELLRERLCDKIEIDIDTARRLFTLICVLHAERTLLWR